MYLLLLHLSVCLWTPAVYFGHVLFVQGSWGAQVNFRECRNASNLHLTGGFAACQQPHERVLSLTDILRCLELESIVASIQGYLWRTDLCSHSFIKTTLSVPWSQCNYTKKNRICTNGPFGVSVQLIITAALSWRYLWKFQIVDILREKLSPGCHNCERIITGRHAALLSEGFLGQYVVNSNSQKAPI